MQARGISAVGSVLDWQSRGHGFKSRMLHEKIRIPFQAGWYPDFFCSKSILHIQVSLARLGAGFGSATGRQLLLRIPAHPRVP